LTTNDKLERPRVACEISGTRVIAARATQTRDAVDLFTSRRSPANLVTPSVHGSNVADAHALTTEIQSALEAVSGKLRDVSLVVPDSAVRVNILDFDALPPIEEEARAVVRLRFRRNVPFEVDDAAVSFHRLPSNGPEFRVLGVAMPKVALDDYEGAVRGAGYLPGVVMPATLAALGAIDTTMPCMVVRHVPAASDGCGSTTTIVIVSGENLLLYRSIENTGEMNPERVLDEVYPSLVFYEDNYGTRLTTAYFDGIELPNDLLISFEEQTGTTISAFPQLTMGQNLSGEPLSGGALAPLQGVLLG
jgi:type IV pilus assembly protein PilM